MASFLEARRNNGRWLVRIEDIDPPREVAGSAEGIIADLVRLGMEPDGEILYQSTRFQAYEDATDRLISQGLAYWCGCSRSDLPSSGVYPGTCRNGIPRGREPRSVRLRTSHVPVIFDDRLQGTQQVSLSETGGDFVIRRADGLPAYQLAVTVDDGFQEISDIVRGADLLDSTPRQVFLQQQLDLSTPGYAHIPVVLDKDGRKLGKRFDSDPVKSLEPVAAIRAALEFLGHQPPGVNSLGEIWHWALENWDINKAGKKT